MHCNLYSRGSLLFSFEFSTTRLTRLHKLHETIITIERSAPFKATDRKYSHLAKLRKEQIWCLSVNNPNRFKYFSRYSASTIMNPHYKEFCFDKYDVIGFDLDNTLLRFNLNEMIPLEYELLRQFLVKDKNYPKELLEKKINLDFIQKGLVLDADRGNVLKLSAKGAILRATHGTTPLTRDEIECIYGENREWDVSSSFFKDPLSTWNGPLSEKMRTILDYFDLAVSLVFAQGVDIIDKNPQDGPYKVWPDILDGLMQLYRRENFNNDRSAYFSALRANPEKYLLKVDSRVLHWMQELRKSGKAIYLLTGSHIDFADFTASYALGKDWRDYFDCVVCFAKKPGFFTQHRPYLLVDGVKELEGSELSPTADLPLNAVYTQGNWRQLQTALAKKIGKTPMTARYLYLGDNLIQDVYTPVKHHDFDAVAFCEELLAEKETDNESYAFQRVVGSDLWGSYFCVDNETTLWSEIISQYSQLCVPLIDTIVKAPITHKFFCENADGYFPKAPTALEP